MRDPIVKKLQEARSRERIAELEADNQRLTDMLAVLGVNPETGEYDGKPGYYIDGYGEGE